MNVLVINIVTSVLLYAANLPPPPLPRQKKDFQK